MDQACIDTTMSDQEYQMPKKIDDVVHVCSIVAMEARDKGCYLQETCNKAPESYQQKTRHESPGDVVTGHHAMLYEIVQLDVPDNIPMPSMVSGDKYLVIEGSSSGQQQI